MFGKIIGEEEQNRMELYFRIVYKNFTTKNIHFEYISLGEVIPIIDGYDVISKDQYIGKRDSSGRMIFIHDILDIPQGYSGDYCIREHYEEVVVEDEMDYYCYDMPDNISYKYCTVIGNIYLDLSRLEYEEALKKLDKEFPQKK